jgi:hypothetical protein
MPAAGFAWNFWQKEDAGRRYIARRSDDPQLFNRHTLP